MAASKSFSKTVSSATLSFDGSEGWSIVSMVLVSGTVTWTGTANSGTVASGAITLQTGIPLNIPSAQPGGGVVGTIDASAGSVAVMAV